MCNSASSEITDGWLSHFHFLDLDEISDAWEGFDEIDLQLCGRGSFCFCASRIAARGLRGFVSMFADIAIRPISSLCDGCGSLNLLTSRLPGLLFSS